MKSAITKLKWNNVSFLSGVWHNFVLCVTALAFLFLLPIFLFPLYSTGTGALVTGIVQVSAEWIYVFN